MPATRPRTCARRVGMHDVPQAPTKTSEKETEVREGDFIWSTRASRATCKRHLEEVRQEDHLLMGPSCRTKYVVALTLTLHFDGLLLRTRPGRHGNSGRDLLIGARRENLPASTRSPTASASSCQGEPPLAMVANLPIAIPYSPPRYYMNTTDTRARMYTDIRDPIEAAIPNGESQPRSSSFNQILFYAIARTLCAIRPWTLVRPELCRADRLDVAVAASAWGHLVLDVGLCRFHVPSPKHFIARHAFSGIRTYHGVAQLPYFQCRYHNEHHDFPNTLGQAAAGARDCP